MNLEQVKNDISKEWESVQAMLKESLKSDCLYLDSINEYLLTLRGKQIRPLLSILAAKAYGEVDERAVVCAVVSEMFHTATLLHDDVADDASKRRKDTVQKILARQLLFLQEIFGWQNHYHYLIELGIIKYYLFLQKL